MTARHVDVGLVQEISRRLPVRDDNAVLGQNGDTDFYWVHWIVSEYVQHEDRAKTATIEGMLQRVGK